MANSIFILKNKLPQVITTGLLASTPVLPTVAAPLAIDAQWACKPGSAGSKWDCYVAPRTPGPVPFAKRAGTESSLTAQPSAESTTVVTGASYNAKAAVQPTAPDHVQAKVLPVQSETVTQAFSSLDWRQLDQLPLNKRSTRSALVCEGDYVEPERPGQDYQGDPAEAPIFAEADKSTYFETGQGTLTGNVVVRQGYRQIESDEAHIDRTTNEADFQGNVVIREPNMLMVGDQADINMDSGHAEIKNAKYVLHTAHAHGEATQITRRESGIILMDDARYTTCKPGSCSWELDGDKVELNPNTGFGTATDATVELWNIPVFYTPWITFPLDDRRKSGLLFPTLSYDSGSDGNGFDYVQPIYWNIAPNVDATITPRFMSNRGSLLESELRYMTSSAEGEIGGGYSTKDRVKEDNRNYDENRWFVNLRHHQNITSNWDYRANYTSTSDRDYFDDFGTDVNVRSYSPLHQELYTTYEGGGLGSNQYTFLLGTQQLKNMTQDSDDPFSKDVDLNLAGHWDIGSDFGLDYTVGYTDFQRDKDWKYKEQRETNKGNGSREGVWDRGPDNITSAVGQRLNTDTTAKYRFTNSYSFVEPGLQLRSVNYDLKRVDKNSDFAGGSGSNASHGYSNSDVQKPSTIGTTYFIDSGLFFDRPVNLGKMTFTQTLEPRAKYVYTPYVKDQDLNPNFNSTESSFSYSSLWNNDRFSGPDRIGDTNHLALGITSRFLEKDGYESFTASVGQIYYFKERRLFIDPNLNTGTNDKTDLDEEKQRRIDDNKASTSPLATQLVWNIRRDLSLTQDWMYNTNKGRNSEYALGMQYLPIAGSVINATYRYRDQVDRAEKYKDGPNEGNNTGRFVNGNLEEADFNMVWPIDNRWSFLGRYTRDLTNKRNMERTIGFEREDCCYMVRVMYRNWIDATDEIDTADRDKGIFLEFVLKGMGSITSSKVDAYLKTISGYSRR